MNGLNLSKTPFPQNAFILTNKPSKNAWREEVTFLSCDFFRLCNFYPCRPNSRFFYFHCEIPYWSQIIPSPLQFHLFRLKATFCLPFWLLIGVEVWVGRGFIFPTRMRSSSGMGGCLAIEEKGDWNLTEGASDEMRRKCLLMIGVLRMFERRLRGCWVSGKVFSRFDVKCFNGVGDLPIAWLCISVFAWGVWEMVYCCC